VLSSGIENYAGVGIDECGGYASQATWDKFETFTKGMNQSRKKHPDEFYYVWHCGASYPEQMVMYVSRQQKWHRLTPLVRRNL
jgi:hypothetical protein